MNLGFLKLKYDFDITYFFAIQQKAFQI